MLPMKVQWTLGFLHIIVLLTTHADIATKLSWTPSLFYLTARREAAAAHVPQAPASRPPPPRIIDRAAVRAAIDEEEVNYRVWEEVTGRYSGWRPG